MCSGITSQHPVLPTPCASSALSPPKLLQRPSHSTKSSPPVVRSMPAHAKRTAPSPVIEPASKRTALQTAQELPTELGEYIVRDVKLLQQLGWRRFIRQRRPVSDFASLDNVQHPAKRLLNFYKHRGAPVKFSTPPWTRRQVKRALARGPHKSSLEYLDFLREEFVDMISKGQWIILPASVAKDLPGLRVSPPGVVPQRDRRPRWYVTTAGGMSITTPSPWQPWNPCSSDMPWTASCARSSCRILLMARSTCSKWISATASIGSTSTWMTSPNLELPSPPDMVRRS